MEGPELRDSPVEVACCGSGTIFSTTFSVLFLNQSCPCLFSIPCLSMAEPSSLWTVFLSLHFYIFHCPFLDTIHLWVPLSSMNIQYYFIQQSWVKWIQQGPSFRGDHSIRGGTLVGKMLQEPLIPQEAWASSLESQRRLWQGGNSGLFWVPESQLMVWHIETHKEHVSKA